LLGGRKNRLRRRFEPCDRYGISTCVREPIGTIVYLLERTVDPGQAPDVTGDQIAIELEHRKSLRIILIFESFARRLGIDACLWYPAPRSVTPAAPKHRADPRKQLSR
jgi:hypothetical protein